MVLKVIGSASISGVKKPKADKKKASANILPAGSGTNSKLHGIILNICGVDLSKGRKVCPDTNFADFHHLITISGYRRPCATEQGSEVKESGC